jgi:hypothetical protein
MEKKNARKILMGKCLGKNLLGRQRRRYEDNIKMEFKSCRVCED